MGKVEKIREQEKKYRKINRWLLTYIYKDFNSLKIENTDIFCHVDSRATATTENGKTQTVDIESKERKENDYAYHILRCDKWEAMKKANFNDILIFVEYEVSEKKAYIYKVNDMSDKRTTNCRLKTTEFDENSEETRLYKVYLLKKENADKIIDFEDFLPKNAIY